MSKAIGWRTRRLLAGACIAAPGVAAAQQETALGGDSSRVPSRGAPPVRPDTVKPDTSIRVQNTSIISPIVFYAPETGWGGGGGLVYVRMAAGDARTQRPSTYQVSLVGTERMQVTLQALGDIWTSNNTNRFNYEIVAQQAPGKFFGIGPNTPETSEKYTPINARLILTGQHRMARHFFMGARYFLERSTLKDVTAGPLISGSVPGQQGWWLTTLSGVTTYDSRDRYYSPLHGVYATLQFTRADRAIGSEFAYWRLVTDVRWYRALIGEHVVALQFYMDDAWKGTPPFERMPRLGGQNILRGFFGGRFRDNHAMAFQGEYRTPEWWKLAAVAFIGTGGVAPSQNLYDARTFRTGYGVGLRWAITHPDRLNLRIDHGWGPGSSGTYFTVGEAF